MKESYKINKDLELYEIYPLTITKDRYGGVYSGGTVLAVKSYSFPEEVFGDDTTCSEFWTYDSRRNIIGVGNTIHDAIVDLANKIDEYVYAIGNAVATFCNNHVEEKENE